MCCDYYIQTEIIIEYLDTLGRKSVIYTNLEKTKGYIFSYQYYDSDDDSESLDQKYNRTINRIIKENTYKKIIYDNNIWIEEAYKKCYWEKIQSEFNYITNIKKIYKKVTAWESN